VLFILVNLVIIDELKQLTMIRWSVAEHEQYETGDLKIKRRVKQSGNILKLHYYHLKYTYVLYV
jgi:hypothetical protein